MDKKVWSIETCLKYKERIKDSLEQEDCGLSTLMIGISYSNNTVNYFTNS